MRDVLQVSQHYLKQLIYNYMTASTRDLNYQVSVQGFGF